MYVYHNFYQYFKKSLLYLTKRPLYLLTAISSLLYFATDCFYVLLSGPLKTFYPSGDEPHYLVICQTLLKYHSLAVMLDYRHRDYLQFYPILLQPHVVLNAHNQLLPLHSIGGPLLWLIPYALLGRLGVVFCISLISVLIVTNIYQLLRLMDCNERISYGVTLAYAIASPLYVYSHLIFIELLGAFICLYAFRKAMQPEISFREIWLSSLLLAFLPWLHIRFALLEVSLFLLLLYKLYRQHRLRHITQDIALFLPLTLSFLIMEVFLFMVWGTWNPAASQISNHNSPFEIMPLQSIFLGLFFDQEYGLFFAYPFFLFLLIGLAFSIRKRLSVYNLSMLIISVPYIIIFASFRNWFGGANPPGRYLLVLLPLYCYYIAYALEHCTNWFARFWFWFSLVYGLFYNLASLAPPHNGFNIGSGINSVLELLTLLHLPVTRYLPSLFACNRSHSPACQPHEALLFAIWLPIIFVLALFIILPVRKNMVRSFLF